VAHTRDDVFFDQGGEILDLGGSSTPVAFRPSAPIPFVPPTPTAGKPLSPSVDFDTPTPFAPVPFIPPFIPFTPTPTFTPTTGLPFAPIPPGGLPPFIPFQPQTPTPFIPPLLPPTQGLDPMIPGFGQPSGPSLPTFGTPGAPPGATGFGFTPTPQQGAGACNLLPAGAARDACLVAATFLPGGQTPTFSPLGATPGGFISPPATGGGGMQAPMVVQRLVHKCPRFANGTGILWMNMAGQVVCLPRGHNGKDLGLIRKNPKRKKAFISAAQIKQLKSVDRTKKKAKVFAKLAGLHTHKGHRSR